jgi:hypothetical protein
MLRPANSQSMLSGPRRRTAAGMGVQIEQLKTANRYLKSWVARQVRLLAEIEEQPGNRERYVRKRVMEIERGMHEPDDRTRTQE